MPFEEKRLYRSREHMHQSNNASKRKNKGGKRGEEKLQRV
jgi:hypothetical protein